MAARHSTRQQTKSEIANIATIPLSVLLGLFIVRSIVRRHRGQVTAESAGEGHGSTFSIRLPRVYRT